MSFLPGKQPEVQSTPYNPVETRNTWETGFFSRFPWSGISALIGAILCAAASAVILMVSDGRVTDWRLQPTVYLAITSALSSILVHYALSVGVTNAWWRKSMKEGTTVDDLHRYWDHGNSLWSAIIAGKHFNLIALASIMASLTPISGPLIQRASTVSPQALLRNVTMSVNIAPELPYAYTALLSGRGYNVAVLTPSFSSVMRDYNNMAIINMTNTGCGGVCSTTIRGAGFAMNCSKSTVPFDLSFQKQGNSDSFSIANTTVFQSNFTHSETNAGDIEIKVQYKATSDCSGDLIVSTCLLRSAIVDYPVVFHNNSVMLAPSSSIIDDKVQRLIPVRGNVGALGGTTLGGISFAMKNKFGTTAESRFTGAVGPYTLTSSGALATEYLNVASDNVTKSPANGCNLTYSDPTTDLIAAAREIMFRTAIRAANASTVQQVQAEEEAVRTVYRSHYLFLGLSIVVTMLGVIFVIPIIGGWWHLGRDVSMSPIETAKALSAPLLRGHDSNMKAKDILKEVGRKDLRYGEVVRINGVGIRGDEYVPPHTPNTTRTLEMAYPAWVKPPQEGSRYDG